MQNKSLGLWQRIFHRRAIRRWARLARNAEQEALPALRVQRSYARAARAHLDRLIHIADDRLALPSIGSSSIEKPHNADWAWRPGLWRGALPSPGMSSAETRSKLGEDVTVFHDCVSSELTLRQIRNTRAHDLAPYGVRMDVFRFDGSFLSLVIDLPNEAIEGLKRSHLLSMAALVEFEKPLEIFARLNISHGPNTEQIVRELPLGKDAIAVEFDLAYSSMNEKRVDKAWIDLIFEGPEMNQITLRDVTLSRRPRAPL